MAIVKIDDKIKPYGRVCPLDLETGFISISNADGAWIIPDGEYNDGSIKPLNSGHWFITITRTAQALEIDV